MVGKSPSVFRTAEGLRDRPPFCCVGKRSMRWRVSWGDLLHVLRLGVRHFNAGQAVLKKPAAR